MCIVSNFALWYTLLRYFSILVSFKRLPKMARGTVLNKGILVQEVSATALCFNLWLLGYSGATLLSYQGPPSFMWGSPSKLKYGFLAILDYIQISCKVQMSMHYKASTQPSIIILILYNSVNFTNHLNVTALLFLAWSVPCMVRSLDVIKTDYSFSLASFMYIF